MLKYAGTFSSYGQAQLQGKKNHEVNPRKSKATAIKTLKLSQKRW